MLRVKASWRGLREERRGGLGDRIEEWEVASRGIEGKRRCFLFVFFR